MAVIYQANQILISTPSPKPTNLCWPRFVIELFNTSVDPSMEYQRMRDLGTDSTLHVIVAFSPKKEYRFMTEDQR